MISKKINIITIFTLTLFFIVGCKQEKDEIIIKKGILDISKIEQLENEMIKLSGEWEFYPNQFLNSADFKNNNNIKKDFIQVPSTWNKYGNDNNVQIDYATYRTNLKISDTTKQIFSLLIFKVQTSAKIFINGKIVGEIGKVAKNIENTKPNFSPAYFSFYSKKNTEIIIHVANFHHHKGGIVNEIFFGRNEKVGQTGITQLLGSAAIIGIFLIMSLLFFVFFLLRSKEKVSLFFSLTLLFTAIRVLTTGEYHIYYLGISNWQTIIRLEYISTFLSIMFFTTYTFQIFTVQKSIKILRFIQIYGGLHSVFIIFSSVKLFSSLVFLNEIYFFLSFIYVLYLFIKRMKDDKILAITFLAGVLIVFVAVANDILLDKNIIGGIYLFHFAASIFVLIHSFILLKRFAKTLIKTEKQAEKLTYMNKNLEKIVKQRTVEIEQQKEEISSQKDNIEKQHKIVLHQNRHITDSINYAERIQKAALSDKKILNDYLPENFIIYKPKDIVSGDFYWFKKIIQNKNKILITAIADCTGHGVPGGFISMLGISYLEEITQNITTDFRAANILEKLRSKIKNGLQDDQKQLNEGMDIALCIIDKNNMKMQYSGAYNPLILIRNGKLFEIKATRSPIGAFRKEKPFENHDLQIKKGDFIDLLSDGFQDQYGGEKGNKFKIKRFKELLTKINTKDIAEQEKILNETLDKWKGKNLQTDDILVFGVKIN